MPTEVYALSFVGDIRKGTPAPTFVQSIFCLRIHTKATGCESAYPCDITSSVDASFAPHTKVKAYTSIVLCEVEVMPSPLGCQIGKTWRRGDSPIIPVMVRLKLVWKVSDSAFGAIASMASGCCPSHGHSHLSPSKDSWDDAMAKHLHSITP